MMVQGLFLIQELKEAKTQRGDPFIILTIADKTGKIDIKFWNMPLTEFPHKVGEIVNMEIIVEDYKGKTTGKIERTMPLDEKPFAPDFHKASAHDPVEMWAEFYKFMGKFSSPYFTSVADDLFDPESTALFCEAPAATGMHHAFKHGLLEHTLQMLQCGEALLNLPFFHELNKDLCMFGIMFHDFGKIYEYSCEPGFKKKIQGLLVGHISMVSARVLEAANKYGVPEMVRDHMMHVVLAHHRLKEWGSPVTFACPEAAFVHYVDNLHGDVFGIIQKREEAKEESISYGFGDQGTKILKESFNETLEKMKGVEGGF
jgi:3'-5' exoribonuclease